MLCSHTASCRGIVAVLLVAIKRSADIVESWVDCPTCSMGLEYLPT